MELKFELICPDSMHSFFQSGINARKTREVLVIKIKQLQSITGDGTELSGLNYDQLVALRDRLTK